MRFDFVVEADEAMAAERVQVGGKRDRHEWNEPMFKSCVQKALQTPRNCLDGRILHTAHQPRKINTGMLT